MRCLALVLAACGATAATTTPDAPSADQENGGTLSLAACGYSVATLPGATAPVMVPAGSAPLGADPTPRQVHLGLRGDPAHDIVVLWRTGDETTLATTVRYGKLNPTQAATDGFSFRYITGYGSDGPRVRMHETHLCGLEADTMYVYQVGGKGSDGKESWSPVYTFRTAPDPAADASAQVSMVVLGDTRGVFRSWGPILVDADNAAAPDLVLFTGDVVALPTLQAEWDQFFEDAQPVLSHVPLVVAKGNHEVDSLAYASMNALPGDELDYALDYGPVHLTVLDDTPDDTATITGAARDFLGADLAAHQAAPWLVLMHHRPMFSSAENHGSDLALRAAWEPLVDQYGVDLVLNGHDHDYERTKPVRAGVAGASGAVYLVSGGLGDDLYRNAAQDFTAVSESVQHYVVITARTGKLDGRAYRADGTLLDSFSLTK